LWHAKLYVSNRRPVRRSWDGEGNWCEVVKEASGIRGIKAGDPHGGVAGEQRMEIEFTLGFGCGKRVQEIGSIREVGNKKVLEGSIWVDRGPLSRVPATL